MVQLVRSRTWALVCLCLCSCPGGRLRVDGGEEPGPAPEITSIAPVAGALGGSTEVSIRGIGFEQGARIFFGELEATSVVFVNKSLLTAITPPATQPGRVDVRVTQSHDQSHTLPAAFTYEGSTQRTLEQALVRNAPFQRMQGAGPVTVTVLADVGVTQSTQGAGRGAWILAQVGYGATTSDLATPPAFLWVDAVYLSDVDGATSGDLFRDRYSGKVTLPGGVSDYVLAARFSIDGGTTWINADRDGSSNGFSVSQLPRVLLGVPVVESCRVTPLVSNTVVSGGKLTVWGRIKVLGATESPGKALNIRAQVGVGTEGTNAETDPGWGWKEAAYFGDVVESGEDEYSTEIRPAYTGTRAVSVRFTLDDGKSWTYCDLNAGGYEPSQQPALLVNPHDDMDFCNLQFPATVETGTADIYGQVYEAGLTETNGEPAGVVAELGYGTRTEDPGVSDKWTWKPAVYNTQVGNNDEYKAQLGLNTGSHDYAFRFSKGGDSAHCYGDLDGSTTGGFSGGLDATLNLGRTAFP